MNWYEHRVVRQQWMLLLLIVLMCLIQGFQTFGPEGADDRFMVVPLEITTSWQAVGSGEATIDDVSTFLTLVSNTFLHGGGSHLVYNLLLQPNQLFLYHIPFHLLKLIFPSLFLQ